MKRDAYYVFGEPDLCCWKVAPHSCWIQTRHPVIAAMLKQRQDAHLVLWSCGGQWVRVYEVEIPLRLAIKAIQRYQTKLKAIERAEKAAESGGA